MAHAHRTICRESAEHRRRDICPSRAGGVGFVEAIVRPILHGGKHDTARHSREPCDGRRGRVHRHRAPGDAATAAACAFVERTRARVLHPADEDVIWERRMHLHDMADHAIKQRATLLAPRPSATARCAAPEAVFAADGKDFLIARARRDRQALALPAQIIIAGKKHPAEHLRPRRATIRRAPHAAIRIRRGVTRAHRLKHEVRRAFPHRQPLHEKPRRGIHLAREEPPAHALIITAIHSTHIRACIQSARRMRCKPRQPPARIQIRLPEHPSLRRAHRRSRMQRCE